jgi:hypothetical protein
MQLHEMVVIRKRSRKTNTFVVNRKVSQTSSYAHFTFVMKLLHIKSFSQMSNVTFNATMMLLQM